MEEKRKATTTALRVSNWTLACTAAKLPREIDVEQVVRHSEKSEGTGARRGFHAFRRSGRV